MTATLDDRWQGGDLYDTYMGRWSRKVAAKFLAWLDPQSGLAWLDVGCGTGALTETVLEFANPASITGIDPADSIIATTRSRIADPRATFEVADALSLPVEDQSVDFTVSGLCLNFVPDPEKALSEMARVTRPGGSIAAYVWDYAGEMQMLRRFWDAAVKLDPAAADLDVAGRFPLCAPAPLGALFEKADLKSVEVVDIQIDTIFADFADFWSPFEAGTGPGPAPSYVQKLPPENRAALKAGVQRTLPAGPDGSIHLIARAWAVRGRR